MKNTFPAELITEPTLLLNETICKENIRRMAEKASRHNLIFRPHFKTHQSTHIGEWFRQAGVDRITVSSLKMAEYFSEAGWNDITVAFPVNLREIERIQKLASRVRLNLLMESIESADFLQQKLETPVNAYIKIDVGYHRTGIQPEKSDQLEALLNRIENSPKLNFTGFLAHAGHSYQARSEQEIAEVHAKSTDILKKLGEIYRSRFPKLMLSTGDTPTCSVMEDFDGINEIRPGNFVFYDLTQHAIGSCSVDNIAVALACPVVAKHEDRHELLVYGGGVHFSKDRLAVGPHGQVIFGTVVGPGDNGWETIDSNRNYVSKLSQEHGTVRVERDVFDQYAPGDIMLVLPVHSCMTANLMKRYLTLSGEWIDRL